MVVMMNPGSSLPSNITEFIDVETPVVTDRTQLQIIKVMTNCNLNYARILNLSDVVEAKSSHFYNLIGQLEAKSIEHSIFSDKNSSVFKSLFVKDIPVIIAWGVNEQLSTHANRALTTLGNIPLIGIKKHGTSYGFYHPLPPVYSKQTAWVKAITKQLLNIT